ncbi:MAG: Na/Pi cotransporter family protein [Oscillospiraceae bacterium]|nr:Na/Pi cotransporter family protein [Oscillospiraceae bacterium]
MGIANTIALLGGLAFFLFGMTLLGDGLKRVAGSKLEIILGKLTATTFKGVLLGALVTAVIQSSSATTVMVVGFVNSGIMKLVNAIGIIIGANIGTTATGWILVLADVEGSGAFSSATMFALIAFIGIILFFFCKNSTKKSIGMIMLAFSVLMSGMQSMSGAMAPLKTSPAFLNFISAVSNPLVAILVGIAVTAVIQSCSASIGILQALSITGVISYEVAVPMVLGMCIGACAPVLLSAIGANVNGKRAAFVYLYFNIAGSILLMIPFYILHAVVGLDFMSATATSMGIAIVNTTYKVLATCLLAPFAKVLEKLAVTTIREKKSDEDDDEEDNLLDERFLDYPPLALEQCGKTLLQMSTSAFKNLNRAISLFSEFKPERFEKILRREEKVDRYEDHLGAYLVKLHRKELNEKETLLSGRYLNCLGNLERVSDHAVNIAELAEELSRKRVSFSEQAAAELRICIDAVTEITKLTQEALESDNVEKARMVEPLEDVIDALTQELKVRHIQRVQEGRCTLELGFIFNDCINNFERVADHCSNIAVAILEGTDASVQSHAYLHSLKENDRDEYRERFNEWAKKYYDALVAVE